MGLVTIDPLDDVLTEPDPGEDRLPGHDKTYDTIRDGVDEVVARCNEGIDFVNDAISRAHIDFQIPRLWDQSLDEYVVFPISGNYYRIQQNSSACGILKDGMGVWAENMGKLAVGSVGAFEGKVHAGFVAHMGCYSLVMDAIGGVMALGSQVFDSIATVSEKVAIRVKATLITLGTKLLRLGKTLAKRFLGAFGVAELAWELLTKGLAVVTEVIDDVTWCIDAIDKAFELKDTIVAWAETQAYRLDAFKEIVSIVQELPTVDLGVPLGDGALPDQDAIRELMEALDISFDQTPEGQEAEDEVIDETDDLVDDSGYVHSSWTDACVVPPMGYEQTDYWTLAVTPSGEVLTDVPSTTEEMPRPIDGRSSTAYYAMYERWRRRLQQHGLPCPPPATGDPGGL